MEEIGLTALLNEVLSIARRHYLRLPSNLALLIKTMMMVEGIAKHLRYRIRINPVALGISANG